MPSPSQRVWRAGNALLVIALIAMAVHLRPGATAIGPVLSELQTDLGFGDTFAGLLTALPGLGFAIVGIFASGLGARLGISRALTLALAAVAVGLLARAYTSEPWSFLALTFLAIAGMGVGNVLVPPFIKANFGLRTARMTSVYTVGLAVGATLPALLNGWLVTLPGGWRTSIRVWGLTAFLAIAPWIAVLVVERRERASASAAGAAPGTAPSGPPEESEDSHPGEVSEPADGESLDEGAVPTTGSDHAVPAGAHGPGTRKPGMADLLRSRAAVALAIFFGTQSMHAYVSFGWLTQAYRDGGLDAASASLMTAILLAFGIPVGFLMPLLVARLQDLRPVMMVLGLGSFSGFLGVLLLPTTVPWLWVILLGISSAAFPTAIALITARTRDHHVTMQVSAFVQSVGYVVAAAGPFLVGVALDVFGGWHVPLIALSLSGLVLAVVGIIAVSSPMIDDDLAHAR